MPGLKRVVEPIDIYSAKFRCTCGHVFRITYTNEFKTFMPRKCEKCGRINKDGYIIEVD